ncbi:MAG: hypothetical protein K6E30_07825 [Lachnospiraceae bacterium]|nr:hypothetical protein [Lachnospiraceae bacterium]
MITKNPMLLKAFIKKKAAEKNISLGFDATIIPFFPVFVWWIICGFQDAKTNV